MTDMQRFAFWMSASLLALSLGSLGCYKYTLQSTADTETNDSDSQTDDTDTSTPDSETNQMDTNAECPAAGSKGVDCDEPCASIKLAVQQCANAEVECGTCLDSNYETATVRECFSGEDKCFPVDFDFTLADRFYVDRIRFMADWHNKRPSTWDLLASDDGVHYTLVISAQSNSNPWNCVQDAPCTEAVPKECCPGGVTQDISAVGEYFPKWDDFRFTGAVAKYWRFRVHSIFSATVTMEIYELEFYGNKCLGTLCSHTSCDIGICTGDRPAACTCADCQPSASCTSAFVGTGEGCV